MHFQLESVGRPSLGGCKYATPYAVGLPSVHHSPLCTLCEQASYALCSPSACWQRVQELHQESLNPANQDCLASSTEEPPPLGLEHFFNLLSDQDAETNRLKEAEKERNEKDQKRVAQNNARNAAESLTNKIAKYTNNIRKGIPGAGKNVTAAAKKACGVALQAYKDVPKDVEGMKKLLTKTGYDPESVKEVQQSSRALGSASKLIRGM